MTLLLRELGLEFDVCHDNEMLLAEFESIVTQKVKAKYFASFLAQVCWIKMRMDIRDSMYDDMPTNVAESMLPKQFGSFLESLWLLTNTNIHINAIVKAPLVQQHLKKWNKHLWTLYKSIASIDGGGITTIRFTDFQAFAHLCTFHFKQAEIMEIYQTANGNFGCHKWNKKSKMNFEAFVQALIVIAAKKDGNLYKPLNIRIVRYIGHILKSVLKVDV